MWYALKLGLSIASLKQEQPRESACAAITKVQSFICRVSPFSLATPCKSHVSLSAAPRISGYSLPIRRVSHIRHNNLGVQVTCENGAVFRADALVMAAPLGVLKTGTIQFTPKLPEWKQSAIDGLGVGHENKVRLHCYSFANRYIQCVISTCSFLDGGKVCRLFQFLSFVDRLFSSCHSSIGCISACHLWSGCFSSCLISGLVVSIFLSYSWIGCFSACHS